MAQQVSLKDYGGPAPDNYERYFVPVIPAPLAGDLIETAAILPGEHVVDVACGTGVVTRLASERVGASGRVVGVDLNPAMSEVARANPAPPGASIEWYEASAEALPFPDESFDVVLCQLGLMFVADRTAALREMRRVLSSGGRVAINVAGADADRREALGREVVDRWEEFVEDGALVLQQPVVVATARA